MEKLQLSTFSSAICYLELPYVVLIPHDSHFD
jgi:hypothetical protein